MSASACGLFRRAYNRAARVAARQLRWRPGLREDQYRTMPALSKLRKWTTWERRRAAERAAAVSTIWHRDVPRSLRAMLRGAPEDVQRRRVPTVRPLMHARTAFGERMFGVWAPRVLEAVLRGSVLAGLPAVPASQTPTLAAVHHQPPSDEWAAQRRAYQAEVVHRYQGWRGFALPPAHEVCAAEMLRALLLAARRYRGRRSGAIGLPARFDSLPLVLRHLTLAYAGAARVASTRWRSGRRPQRELAPVEVLHECRKSRCLRLLLPVLGAGSAQQQDAPQRDARQQDSQQQG
eukprot:gene9209-13390_t